MDYSFSVLVKGQVKSWGMDVSRAIAEARAEVAVVEAGEGAEATIVQGLEGEPVSRIKATKKGKRLIAVRTVPE